MWTIELRRFLADLVMTPLIVMARYEISDADYQRLAPLLPGRDGTRGRSGTDNRRFLNALVFMARNGGPWRDLPPTLGHWNTVWRRFDRWSRAGVWQRLFDTFQDPDLDWLLIDTTSIRAHQHAAGARKRGIRPSRQLHAKHSDAHAVG